MRKVLGAALAVAGMAVVPAVALAQMHGMGERPPHEFGVDLNLYYSSLGSLVSGGSSTNHIVFFTPVDVRAGFTMSGPLSPEARIGFAFDSKGVVSGSNSASVYALFLGVNELYRFGTHTGSWQQYGPYATLGVALNLAGVGSLGTTPSSSTTQFGINGGVGTRIQYHSGAFRPELYVAYFFKNTGKSLPSDLRIGARVGLSLWH